jgi:PKD repeat protein
MRNFLLTVLLLFGSLILTAKDGYYVNFTQVTSTTSQVEFTLVDYSYRHVNIQETDYSKIVFPGSVTTMDAGFAELPFINANIRLNPEKNVTVNIIGIDYQDYRLDFPLVPSRGVIYRNEKPSEIPYVIAPESLVDEFYPSTLTSITEPYIIKDVRGTTVYVYPFQYNAVQKILRVYTSVTVELTENDTEPINPIYETTGKFFRDMEALYQTVFINYETNMENLTVGDVGDILVVTTARDEAAIQPFIDWKMAKGHNVFKEVVPTGTNVKTLIQQKYNENNNILFVQLVGDWADIKSDQGGGANAPMDPMLGCVVGTDNFPDIAIGRFSANSPAHVTVQVNKAINYEKNPSGNWYANAIGIASSEGAGIGDDGESDIQHNEVIWNHKLSPFTYDNYSPAYEPGATAIMVKNYIENGASVINYTGHGSLTSWSTSGFSNSHINQLTNGDMLPFIFSVACVNGAFHSGECFAEAWLKKEGGGAVICIAGTINQPWAPPMRGQDYFNDLIIGGYNYTTSPGNGISTTEGRSSIGSIVTNGLVLMYTESNGTQDLQTIQTWTTFGDASLQVRTAAPQPISLSGNVMLVGAPFETTITSNGAPVANALVSLSQDGVYSSAYTDDAGYVSVPNEFLPGDVLLVVTAFNTETIYENIQCIPPTGPYVIFDAVEINDLSGNNNGQLDYGETVGLNLSVKNVGVFEATDIQVTIVSSNEYITIINGTANFGNVPAGAVVMVENAFTIEAANNIPNKHNIIFELEAEAPGEEAWESTFSILAYAAMLDYDSYYVVDQYGVTGDKLDPGETVDMFIVIKNAGESDASGVIGTLSSNDPFITISSGPMSYGNVAAGEEAEMSFVVFANESTPAGHIANFDFDIVADLGLTAQAGFSIVVGQIPVLIIDMDGNQNSANRMIEALDDIGVSYTYVNSFPSEDLHLYSSIFVCLGVYSNNHTLTQAQGQLLASYLNQGGNLYMEGGDTWYYDTQTPVHPLFSINPIADGSSDLSTIAGMAGTFTEGMSYPYNGDNSWIDRIAAAGSAVLILQNTSPSYGTGVAYEEGSYKTIGASHEFGGLNGDRTALMEAYLDFFDLLPATLIPNFLADLTEGCEGMEVAFTDMSLGAVSWLWTFPGGTPETSAEQNPLITYLESGAYHVTLEVSDGVNNISITKPNYIHVMHEPEQAGPITGSDQVAMGDVTDYHVDQLDLATQYLWVLTPEEAGEMVMDMNTVTIHFSETWHGTAHLKVCGGNECGMGEYSEEFEIEVTDVTGITTIEETALNIYPNPTKGQFVIEMSSRESVTYQMGIVNLLGVEVLQKTIEVNGAFAEVMDVSSMPDGVYYLYLRNDEQSIVRKLIIQK